MISTYNRCFRAVGVFLVYLFCLSGVFAFDDAEQRKYLSFSLTEQPPGILQADHILALDEHGYWLGNRQGTAPVWEYRVYTEKPVSEFFLQLNYEGELNISLSGPSKTQSIQLSSPDGSSEFFNGAFKFFPAVNELTLRVAMKESASGFLHSVEFKNNQHVPFVGFDERYTFTEQKQTVFKRQERADFPLGVNLEAGYLFNDLDRQKRTALLDQIVFDGFSTVRLHKLYRVFQSRGLSPWFLREIADFISEIFARDLDLYLDIISWPRPENEAEEGWKQDFFLDLQLQFAAAKWLSELAGLEFDGVPLFGHRRLKWLCLINENSLFFEESPKSRYSALRLYADELSAVRAGENAGHQKPFIGFSAWKQNKMLAVYRRFENLLRHHYGYEGELFLSNYGAGGPDSAVNIEASGVVDRHFYFDYPNFINSFAVVKNLSPIRERENLLEHFMRIFPAEGGYISEINLPWPNRWQHELVPFILYMHKKRPLKGLWFYDYRLRDYKDFHKGGIFGVQKFYSVIGQLPYLKKVWQTDYTVREVAGGMAVSGKDFYCFSGLLQGGWPVTIWQTAEGREVFSLERADRDLFDELNLRQLRFGKKAQRLLLPEEKFMVPIKEKMLYNRVF